MTAKKSPITDKLLRQAGQSVHEQLQSLVFEKLYSYGAMVMVLWVLTIFEWIQHFRSAPPAPVPVTVLAAGVTLFVLIRGYGILRQARRYRQGMHGEMAVGEYLDRLRAKGYRVFHDIPDAAGNIDHVIICDRGVFTVETKTMSKPVKGDPIVTYDGSAVSVDGSAANDRPIAQALAQASKLRKILKESTGHDYDVQPTVVYPGWYVEALPGAQSKTWVLNPKGLHKFIDNRPAVLSADRVKLAASQLGKFVRSIEAK